ncbi:hypothetical protein OROGR_010554 [Orobanche gracilis]
MDGLAYIRVFVSILRYIFKEETVEYIRVFVSILRYIFKEETVEYVLALVDEMLSANPKRARLFYDKSLADEDTLLWNGNWFIQEKSCKILSFIVSGRPKSQDGATANGALKLKKEITTIHDVLKGLVEWLFAHVCPSLLFALTSYFISLARGYGKGKAKSYKGLGYFLFGLSFPSMQL